MASRFTFHKPAGEVAWQRQLRDQFASLPSPPLPPDALTTARVQPVSYAFAKSIILRYEWLGTMAASTYHYGLFCGRYCAGVCCICLRGGTPNRALAAVLGLSPDGLGYLARGACVHWAPPGANSKLVAWTARLFAQSTGAKALIAYADTDAGEIGTIYQACGWVYIGRGGATQQWVAPEGRVYDAKILGNMRRDQGITRQHAHAALVAHGWTQQQSNPKHRYVCVMDKQDRALQARLAALRQPYPKRTRAGSIASDAPPLQGGEGSAPLTPALSPLGLKNI